jgi:hypothetical protein
MSGLSKTKPLPIRFTAQQRKRIADAARIVSRRRGEIVDASTLFRELGMQAIDELLAESDTALAGRQAVG